MRRKEGNRGRVVPYCFLRSKDNEMISSELIESFVEKELEGTDCFLVDISVSASNKIMVEVDRNEGVSLDFCIHLSKSIESQLDREEEDFELEVASATLGSPFKVYKQYIKNLGMDVSVLTTNGVKEEGVLAEVNEKGLVLEIVRKIKPEGKKRKEEVLMEVFFAMDQIKEIRNIIKFK